MTGWKDIATRFAKSRTTGTSTAKPTRGVGGTGVGGGRRGAAGSAGSGSAAENAVKKFMRRGR